MDRPRRRRAGRRLRTWRNRHRPDAGAGPRTFPPGPSWKVRGPMNGLVHAGLAPVADSAREGRAQAGLLVGAEGDACEGGIIEVERLQLALEDVLGNGSTCRGDAWLTSFTSVSQTLKSVTLFARVGSASPGSVGKTQKSNASTGFAHLPISQTRGCLICRDWASDRTEGRLVDWPS